jgi:hypothetical protein
MMCGGEFQNIPRSTVVGEDDLVNKPLCVSQNRNAKYA